MHQEQRARLQEFLTSKGLGCALLAEAPNITWLTGYDPPFGFAAHLYAGGPPLVWYQGGDFTLIVLNAHAGGAVGFDEQPGCRVVTYEGYTIEQPPTPAENLRQALESVIGQRGTGRVGVETRSLPAFLWPALPEGAEPVPIDGWLDPLRMVKTEEELAKIRQNFALIDVAHAAAGEAVQVGRSELDVWIAAHSALQQAAKTPRMFGNDCTVGRHAHLGGSASDRQIEDGDSFVLDLSTELYGYASDSCVTYYAGEPTARQIAMHRTVTEALAFCISLVKPGAVAGEIDGQVRRFIAEAGYPVYHHHTGHGIGARAHELPRLVPHSQEVLEPGMVIMVEPGIYFPGETGIRLEHALLVTADGAEVLTTYDHQQPGISAI